MKKPYKKVPNNRSPFSPVFLPLVSILSFLIIIIISFLLLVRTGILNEELFRQIPITFKKEEELDTSYTETSVRVQQTPTANEYTKPKIEVYNQGEKVIFGNATITLTNTTSGTKIESGTNYSLPCISKNGKLIKVTINFKNTSNESIRVSNFYLFDSENRKFEADNSAFCLEDLIPFSKKLNPGLELTFESLYEIPKDAEGLKLKLSEYIYVSLGF